jgi:hypothetical protein
MSFTNVSLAPAEMIACGVIPVIGNLRCTHADLDTPHARWINPTPRALADELCSVIEASEPSPVDVAASIQAMSWDSAQGVFLETLDDEVYGARTDS